MGSRPRLTKSNIQKILDKNEGFEKWTHNSQKNFCEDRKYSIHDGKLHIRATGDTSWSDSDYDDEFIADSDQVHRFLYNYLDELETDDLD